MIHQQHQPPHPHPVQQQALPQASLPGIPQPGPPGPPIVPTLMSELASIAKSLHAVKEANPNTQIPPSTTTPRLNSGHPPPLPPNFDIHSPSQYPPDILRLRPQEQSSPRQRLRQPHQSRSEPSNHHVHTAITPTFDHPSQVKAHWRDNGRRKLLQNRRQLDFSDDDDSQDDLLKSLFDNSHPVTQNDAVQSAAPLVTNNSAITATTANASVTTTAPTHSVNNSAPVTTASHSTTNSAAATVTTNSVNAPITAASAFHQSNNSVPSASAVDQNESTLSQQDLQVNNQNDPDNQRNLEIQKNNTETLNKLANIVQDFPEKPSFKEYAFLDPINNDFKRYNLPDFLRPYVSQLLQRMNTSQSLLPPNLYPYIQFDTKLNRYVTSNSSLDLPSLQRLNHLLNVDKAPNFLTKIKDSVTKRNKSK